MATDGLLRVVWTVPGLEVNGGPKKYHGGYGSEVEEELGPEGHGCSCARSRALNPRGSKALLSFLGRSPSDLHGRVWLYIRSISGPSIYRKVWAREMINASR